MDCISVRLKNLRVFIALLIQINKEVNFIQKGINVVVKGYFLSIIIIKMMII